MVPAAGYDLLLKVEYKGRTLWDCAGANPSDPAHAPGCTVVPPGGLQAKLHLPVLTWLPCLPLTAQQLWMLLLRAFHLSTRPLPWHFSNAGSVQQACKLGFT